MVRNRENRLNAINQLYVGADMSLYYTMKYYRGDITVRGIYKFKNRSRYPMI